MRELAAIAVRHAREQVFPVLARLQFDLRDARKIFAQFVGVLLRRCAKLVEINLLEEMLVRGGPFLGRGIARVENPGAVRVPRRAAAARRILHARNFVRPPLTRGRVVNVERAVLAALLRKRHRHQLAVPRRHEPVNRHAAVRRELVRIEHHRFVREVARRFERDEHRLLRGRLELEQE